MSNDSAGMALIDRLTLAESDGSLPWCLVRWHEGKICGPLSRIGRGWGFPDRGYIGHIARFDSRESAQAEADPSDTRTAVDVATLVSELRFTVFAYSYYDGAKVALCEDTEYDRARVMCDIAKGRVADEPRYKVWLDVTGFLGTPPPRQLERVPDVDADAPERLEP